MIRCSLSQILLHTSDVIDLLSRWIFAPVRALCEARVDNTRVRGNIERNREMRLSVYRSFSPFASFHCDCPSFACKERQDSEYRDFSYCTHAYASSRRVRYAGPLVIRFSEGYARRAVVPNLGMLRGRTYPRVSAAGRQSERSRSLDELPGTPWNSPSIPPSLVIASYLHLCLLLVETRSEVPKHSWTQVASTCRQTRGLPARDRSPSDDSCPRAVLPRASWRERLAFRVIANNLPA